MQGVAMIHIKIEVGISWLWFFPEVSISRYIFHEGNGNNVNMHSLGVIVETEGSIWKMQKKAFFTTKKKLKGAFLIWPPPMEPL